jgi:hypothetical protein
MVVNGRRYEVCCGLGRGRAHPPACGAAGLVRRAAGAVAAQPARGGVRCEPRKRLLALSAPPAPAHPSAPHPRPQVHRHHPPLVYGRTMGNAEPDASEGAALCEVAEGTITGKPCFGWISYRCGPRGVTERGAGQALVFVGSLRAHASGSCVSMRARRGCVWRRTAGRRADAPLPRRRRPPPSQDAQPVGAHGADAGRLLPAAPAGSVLSGLSSSRARPAPGGSVPPPPTLGSTAMPSWKPYETRLACKCRPLRARARPVASSAADTSARRARRRAWGAWGGQQRGGARADWLGPRRGQAPRLRERTQPPASAAAGRRHRTRRRSAA